MDLEFLNNIKNNIKESNIGKDFLNELTNFFKDNKDKFISGNNSKYDEYWNYQKNIDEIVSAKIGISKWSTDIRYHKELNKVIEDSILELSETEGTLYRKKFSANGPINNQTYNIDKFENGKVEHLILSSNEVLKGYDKDDIIFQYKNDGKILVRHDLNEKIVEIASEEAKFLKEEENKKALDYKREGHIYQAIEDDGYIFLKDLSQKREYVFEDIDFVVEHYVGEGKYQVINNEYKKIDE